MYSSDSPRLARTWRPHLLAALLLALATALAFAGALSNDFINIDDGLYVVDNPAVRGFSAGNLAQAFSSFYVGNYAPLHIVSYMVDYSIWGMRPAGFIVGNLLLHLTNGLLLYLLVWRVSGDRLWAVSAGLLFLVHPVQVESVVWISERKNVLAATCTLATLLGYLNYLDKGWQSGRWSYGLSLVFCCCALLTKGAAVVIPLFLVGYLACRRTPGWLRHSWDTAPFFLAAAALAWVTVIAQAPEYGGGRSADPVGGKLSIALTMPTVLLRYLRLIFWPLAPSYAYATPVKEAVDPEVAGALAGLLALAALGLYLYRRRSGLCFWYLVFFAALLPVSHIFPIVNIMSDRYLYFPLLGGAPFLAAGFTGLCRRFPGCHRQLLAAGAAALLGLAWCTHLQAGLWKDSSTLWGDAVRRLPSSGTAWGGLGNALLGEGRYREALNALDQARRLGTRDRSVVRDQVQAHIKLGELDQARPDLAELLRSDPGDSANSLLAGEYHYAAGNLTKAEGAFLAYLGKHPGEGVALNYLGGIYLETGRLEQAAEIFTALLAENRRDKNLHYNIATLEAARGRQEQALAELAEACALGFRDRGALASNRFLATLQQTAGYRALRAKYGL